MAYSYEGGPRTQAGKRRKLEDQPAPPISESTNTAEPDSKEKENTPFRQEVSKQVLYHCDYCKKDITNCVRIRCAECSDFDLCVECFLVGVEINTHKNSHNYQVMDQLDFPVFAEDWGADEELLLLEAIETYGFGNWIDCSDHVGTKTPDECQSHYFNTYIDVPTNPLPNMKKHFDSKNTSRERKQVESNKTPSKKESEVKIGAPTSKQELAGWMPYRGEFETELFNDAEAVVSDFSFNDDDPPTLNELRLKILQIYNDRLNERVEKRKFFVEKELLDLKKITGTDKKRTREEKEVVLQHNAFLQVLPPERFNQFINSTLQEHALRRRIDELKAYRSMGIKTLAEADNYENDKKRKVRGKEEWKRSVPYISPDRKYSRKDERSRKKKLQVSEETATTSIPPPPLATAGIELLSPLEQTLATSLHFNPNQYLFVKSTLIRESLKSGGQLRRSSLRNFFKNQCRYK